MKKQLTSTILLLALLAVVVAAQEAVTVTIDKPQQNEVLIDNDVELEVSMNNTGTLSYMLDNLSDVEACTDCDSFSTTLLDLTNGEHTILVTGIVIRNLTENSTATIISNATVTFTVNETTQDNTTTTTTSSTTTTVDDNTTTTIDGNETDDDEPRFAKGFNKLPKQFAAGVISESELKSILENNQLNPGVINRLAKTGLLTEDLIDTIGDTQFLPSGIWGKVLGLIGFGRNRAFESIIDNYNVTDEQLATLIENSELPPGTAKRLIRRTNLGQQAVGSLLASQGLRANRIEELKERRGLSDEDVQDLIENRRQNKRKLTTTVQSNDEDSSVRPSRALGQEKRLEAQQQAEVKKKSNQGQSKRVNLGRQKGNGNSRR